MAFDIFFFLIEYKTYTVGIYIYTYNILYLYIFIMPIEMIERSHMSFPCLLLLVYSPIIIELRIVDRCRVKSPTLTEYYYVGITRFKFTENNAIRKVSVVQ